MELQPGERAVVTAEHARAARFLDEHALELAPAAVHRARAAQRAAERRRARGARTSSPRAPDIAPRSSPPPRRGPAPSPRRRRAARRHELVPAQPVAHGRVRHTEPLGHRTDRQPFLEQRLRAARARSRRGRRGEARAGTSARACSPSTPRSTAARPVSRAIDSIERPSASWVSSVARSMTDTNTSSCGGRNSQSGGGGSRRAPFGAARRVRVTPVAPVRRALEMWRSRRCRSSCSASSSSLAGVASSAPERTTSSAISRANSSSPAGRFAVGRAQAAAQVRGGLARRGRGEVVVDVDLREPALPLVGQREAVREERGLALLAAGEGGARVDRLGRWRGASRGTGRARRRGARRRRGRRASRRDRAAPTAGRTAGWRPRSASLTSCSPSPSRSATSLTSSCRSTLGAIGPITCVAAASISSVLTPGCSSARSTSKRSIGTASSSSARIASAPERWTTSAGSCPAGRRTIRNSTPRVVRSELTPRSAAIPRATDSCPARSGSWQNSAFGASFAIAVICASVSAVPICATTSGTPAWWSAITSV